MTASVLCNFSLWWIFCPSLSLLHLSVVCEQQSKQREQQRLALQWLSLPLAHFPLPLPRLGPAPAGPCAPAQRLLARLWLHLAGCQRLLQASLTHALRHNQPSKARDKQERGEEGEVGGAWDGGGLIMSTYVHITCHDLSCIDRHLIQNGGFVCIG